MSVARAVASNTIVQVAGKLGGTVLGLVTVGIMTRHLGREGYGAFTTAVSFLQFFGIMVDFGLTLTMVAMISEKDADERAIASNVFTLRLVSGVLFFGIAPIVGFALPYPVDVKAAIALGSLSFLCMTLSQVLIGVFQKRLATHHAAVAEVAGRAVLLAGAAWAAASGSGLLAFIAALVAGNVIQLALTVIFARRHVPLRLSFDLPVWREIVRRSWPIGLSIAFNLVYLKGDIVILSLFRSQAEVGLYGAAYKVLDVITVVPMIFMGLVMPLLAASWSAGDRNEFNRKLGRAFDAMSLLALPLAIGTLPVAADLMRLVAGAEFAASGPLLAVLMLAAASVFWGALFGHAVVAVGMQRKMIWAYALDAAVSIALYVTLIPRFGAIAAAWVTVFSELFIAALTAGAVIGAGGRAPRLGVFGKALAASGVMAALVFVMGPLPVLLRIAAGAAVYAGLLFALGAVTPDVIAMFRRPKPV
jgi:O-antigen/teichoic acid export membrane protein